MPTSEKKCSTGNHSTDLNRKPNEQGKTITFTLTGVRNNHYEFLLRKIIFEFLDEITRGNICAELRLVKKYEAINLLLPEEKNNLIGKTIIIK